MSKENCKRPTDATFPEPDTSVEEDDSLAAVMTGKTTQTVGVNHSESQGSKRARTEGFLDCIYCTKQTWEQKRSDSSSATYKCHWVLYPTYKLRRGLKCTRCHSFMCHACLEQAFNKLQGCESDYEFIKRYLSSTWQPTAGFVYEAIPATCQVAVG